MAGGPLLVELAVLLGLALLAGQLCRAYLGLPIVGELAVGVLLGPSVVGWLPKAAQQWLSPAANGGFSVLSSLSLVTVVGVTGMQFNISTLRKDGRAVLLLAAGAFGLPLAAGAVVAAFLPASLHGRSGGMPSFLVLTAVAVAVSALPVAGLTITQFGLRQQRIGGVILAAATVIDLLAWSMLTGVNVASHGEGTGSVLRPLAALVVLVAMLVGPLHSAISTFLRLVARWDSGAALLAATGLIVATAGVGAAGGIEPVVGALIGGIIVGQCEAARVAAADTLTQLATWICAPIFLVSVGCTLNLRASSEVTVLLSGLVLLAVATVSKVVGGYGGARVGGLVHRDALIAAAALNSRGVVEIVLATVGLRLGLFGPGMYFIVIAIALITSLIALILLRLILGRRNEWAELETSGHFAAGVHERNAPPSPTLKPPEQRIW